MSADPQGQSGNRSVTCAVCLRRVKVTKAGNLAKHTYSYQHVCDNSGSSVEANRRGENEAFDVQESGRTPGAS